MRGLPKNTATKAAACAALGLSYWADHPRPGYVWAVDGRRYVPVLIQGPHAARTTSAPLWGRGPAYRQVGLAERFDADDLLQLSVTL